ncbi:MAG: DUF4032 domain-containing protein [Ktedonobacteraceae bacterium]|nr:DUF4032 domain-containing protein [Ktedonobacteraceae bacterium]MBO0791689.1 DUF4032 domain-containing protein [Ktedonobacteraceae bacterium]
MKRADRLRLEQLPWHARLEEWPGLGVQMLVIRRGESRHPVIFVERGGVRYAIKETTPRMAEREIRNLQEIERRGIPTLDAVGSVIVPGPPIALEVPRIGGQRQYISGDRGYTITRIAPRVVPQVFLYRLNLTKRTKRRLLAAVAVLMIELHEHGIYWGDPSLANVLMRIDGQSILAIMADAETSELFPHPLSDGLREQDMAMFAESLAWQSEDLRQARGLPEEAQVLDDEDFRYFEQRYRWLRKEHAHVVNFPHFDTFHKGQRFLRTLNRWGFSLLNTTGNVLNHITTVRPGWYQKRIYELLHVTVRRLYAHRFYNMILGHQAILSQQRKRNVSLEEAAHNWYDKYHLPAILLLRRVLTAGQDPMQAYFAVMDHKWKLSEEAGYEIPLDQALFDWSMQHAQTGELGPMDPALLAKWWHEVRPAAEVLEPPMIESEELEPLLSTSERPLVRLLPPELEEKLPEILERQGGADTPKE